MNKKRYIIISIIVLVLVVGIILLSSNIGQEKTAEKQNSLKTQGSKKANFEIQNAHDTNWANKELKDVLTEKRFKISDYKNKKHVLLESFAVWCPTCTKQQKQIKEFHKRTEKKVESISLNTDPNEKAQKVKQHAEKNGFDWKYAIPPRETTKKLIDQFGQGFVNAPQSPVVLICKDGKAKMLERGVKSPKELEKAINKC
ncbi:MAG: peroxiredoxin family protein [Candidatus Pacearchaeota archaeon]